MVRICIICKRKYVKDEKVSFHRIPHDEKMRKTWISLLLRHFKVLKITNYSNVCSDHFLESDFVEKPGGVRYLRPNAVPNFPSTSTETHENILLEKEVDIDSSGMEIANQNILLEEEVDISTEIANQNILLEEEVDISTETANQNILLENEVDMDSTSTETTNQNILLIEEMNMDSTSTITSDTDSDVELSQPIRGTCNFEYVDVESFQRSSSTSTASETEFILKMQQQARKKKTVGRRKYVANIGHDDFFLLRKAEKQVLEQKKIIKNLHQNNRRLRARVKCLEALLQYIKDKHLERRKEDTSALKGRLAH